MTVYSHEAKSERQARQLAKLKEARRVPSGKMGSIMKLGKKLHALWPQKLPKVVRAALNECEVSAWRQQRAKWAKANDERLEREMEKYSLYLDKQAIQHSPSMRTHGAAAKEFLNTLQALNSPLILTISAWPSEKKDVAMEALGEQWLPVEGLISNLADDGFVTLNLNNGEAITLTKKDVFGQMIQIESDDIGQFGDNNTMAIMVAFEIAEAMDKGSIVVRQALPMRVQRANEKGEMVWRRQEKVFMARFSEGNVFPLSVKGAKAAYETNYRTGQKMPKDSETHIGDMTALLKKHKVKMG